MLHRLIYASRLSPQVDHHQIREILAVSQRNNAARHISGLLLFNSGFFLQWLEGGRPQISERFARIAQDTRHMNVELISLDTVASRQFFNWNMGYLGEGRLNGALFARFFVDGRFDPHRLSAPAAEAFMLEAGRETPTLTP